MKYNYNAHAYSLHAKDITYIGLRDVDVAEKLVASAA